VDLPWAVPVGAEKKSDDCLKKKGGPEKKRGGGGRRKDLSSGLKYSGSYEGGDAVLQ